MFVGFKPCDKIMRTCTHYSREKPEFVNSSRPKGPEFKMQGSQYGRTNSMDHTPWVDTTRWRPPDGDRRMENQKSYSYRHMLHMETQPLLSPPELD